MTIIINERELKEKKIEVLKDFSHEIISNSYAESIKLLIHQLPVSSLSCIEFRMNDESQRIDYQICPKNIPHELNPLVDYLKSKSEFSKTNLDIWHNLFHFTDKLNEPQSFSKGAIPNLWFVYDIIDPKNQNIAPWIYVGLLDNPISSEINLAVAIQSLNLYTDQDLSHVEKELISANKFLPKDAYLCAIGFMTSRQMDGIRVAYKFSHIEEVFHFLEVMNWGGNIAELRKKFKHLLKSDSKISLAFDLGEKMGLKIGIERFFNANTNKGFINEYIDHLVIPGLVSKSKAKHLKSWIDFNIQKNKNQPWASYLNHFKFTFDQSGYQETKAYIFIERQHQIN